MLGMEGKKKKVPVIIFSRRNHAMGFGRQKGREKKVSAGSRRLNP